MDGSINQITLRVAEAISGNVEGGGSAAAGVPRLSSEAWPTAGDVPMLAIAHRSRVAAPWG